MRLFDWSHRWESNPRPTIYETVALPLSYSGHVAAVIDLICVVWSHRWESNPRPTVYKTVALPLSYSGRTNRYRIHEYLIVFLGHRYELLSAKVAARIRILP